MMNGSSHPGAYTMNDYGGRNNQAGLLAANQPHLMPSNASSAYGSSYLPPPPPPHPNVINAAHFENNGAHAYSNGGGVLNVNDPRYAAKYGNPYLPSSNGSLPPPRPPSPSSAHLGAPSHTGSLQRPGYHHQNASSSSAASPRSQPKQKLSGMGVANGRNGYGTLNTRSNGHHHNGYQNGGGMQPQDYVGTMLGNGSLGGRGSSNGRGHRGQGQMKGQGHQSLEKPSQYILSPEAKEAAKSSSLATHV